MSAPIIAVTPNLRHFDDLRFTVLAIPSQYYVEFIVYDIETYEDGDKSKPRWPRLGARSSPDNVDKLDEAEIYLHGTVKFDGCSDWRFDEQDRIALHGCSRQGVQRFGDVMGRCWDWAAEFMPGMKD